MLMPVMLILVMIVSIVRFSVRTAVFRLFVCVNRDYAGEARFNYLALPRIEWVDYRMGHA